MSSLPPISHCWVCDDHEGLHFLKAVSAPPPPSQHAHKWTTVGGGFRTISAGYDGLVCAVKESSLLVRKYVTHENPVGKGWKKFACDAVRIMAGRTFVVRKSSRGHLYAARVDLTAEVLDWASIPPCHGEGGMVENGNGEIGNDRESLHYAVDDEDRLFQITGRGVVSCCDLLQCSHGNDLLLHWVTISSPPPKLNQGSSWISRIIWKASDGGGSDDNGWVSMVSAGVGGALWCLREGTNEAWQLVIGQIGGTLKSNWNDFQLPFYEDEQVIMLSACKSAADRLYAVVKGASYYKMVSFSLTGEECGKSREEIVLPVRYPCWSVAICSTRPEEVPQRRKNIIAKKRAIPSSPSNSRCPEPKRPRHSVGDTSQLVEGIPVVLVCKPVAINGISTRHLDTELRIPSVDILCEKYDFSIERKVISDC